MKFGLDFFFFILCLQVLNVLKRITNEDSQRLGFNPEYVRPDWMILQTLPIPPLAARPAVMMNASNKSEVSYILNSCFLTQLISW